MKLESTLTNTTIEPIRLERLAILIGPTVRQHLPVNVAYCLPMIVFYVFECRCFRIQSDTSQLYNSIRIGSNESNLEIIACQYKLCTIQLLIAN